MMMFWKLRHALLGTHFAAVAFGFDTNIRAVRWTPAGRPYAKVCGQFIWLDGNDTHAWEALTFNKAAFLRDLAAQQKLSEQPLRVVR